MMPLPPPPSPPPPHPAWLAPARPAHSGLIWLVSILIALAVLAGGVRLWDNITSKPNPPAACQLFGGQWTIWGGWSCG
jgi:hypothetical protein